MCLGIFFVNVQSKGQKRELAVPEERKRLFIFIQNAKSPVKTELWLQSQNEYARPPAATKVRFSFTSLAAVQLKLTTPKATETAAGGGNGTTFFSLFKRRPLSRNHVFIPFNLRSNGHRR